MAVTVAEGKAHLRITDPAQDAEVTLALQHAGATILDYIGAQVNPLPTVKSDLVDRGTLLALAHYWEHRGDDNAPDDHAAALWTELDLLFKRTRLPALA